MNEPVTVQLLDREYHLACTAEERHGLFDAARLLDTRMREIRSGNRMAGIDRIAVLAALQLSHELIQLKQTMEQRDQLLTRTLENLNRRLDALLDTDPI